MYVFFCLLFKLTSEKAYIILRSDSKCPSVYDRFCWIVFFFDVLRVCCQGQKKADLCLNL